MKLINVLLLSTLLLILTACSSDDSLSGIWFLDSLTLTTCLDNDIPESTWQAGSDGCLTLDGEEFCLRFSFDDNGTITSTLNFDGGEDTVESGQYTQTGDMLQLCFDGSCEEARIENDKIILTTRLEGCQADYSFKRN